MPSPRSSDTHLPPAQEQPLAHRFIKFALVGLSGVFVNLGMLAVFVWLGIHRSLASALAIQVSILSNFIVHECWTFSDRRRADGFGRRILSFQGVSMIGAAVQWLTFLIMSLVFFRFVEGERALDLYLAQFVGGWLDSVVRFIREPPQIGHQIYLAQLVGIGFATTWNFAANFLWTWRKQDLGGHHE